MRKNCLLNALEILELNSLCARKKDRKKETYIINDLKVRYYNI